MKRQTLNWIRSSDYDIETAKAMFKQKRYLYVIFMCHLSVERMLKAIAQEEISKMPPKTHDLYYLVKLARLQIPPEHKIIVSHLNEASIPTRYPEDIMKMTKQYTERIAAAYLRETTEFLKWLKKDGRLKR